MRFFRNEIMLNVAHDSRCDNKHQYLKLWFNNKGNIQNNSQIWTPPPPPLRLQEWLLSISRIRRWSRIAQDITGFFFLLLLSPPQINVQFQEGALLFWCSNLFKVVPGMFSSFRNCATKQGMACSEGWNVAGTLTILQGDQPVACWDSSPKRSGRKLLFFDTHAVGGASLPTCPVRRVFFGHLDATPTSVVQPGQLKVSTGTDENILNIGENKAFSQQE